MFVCKRTYNTESIELFKQKLHETKWYEIMSFQNPDDTYKAFLKRSSTLYDTKKKNKIEKQRFAESLDNYRNQKIFKA